VKEVKEAVDYIEGCKKQNMLVDYEWVEKVLYAGTRDEMHMCLRMKLLREYPSPPGKEEQERIDMERMAMEAVGYERN